MSDGSDRFADGTLCPRYRCETFDR